MENKPHFSNLRAQFLFNILWKAKPLRFFKALILFKISLISDLSLDFPLSRKEIRRAMTRNLPPSPARQAAFEVLEALESHSAPPLDDLLHSALGARALSPPDARLCFQLAQGVTRHRAFLDSIAAPFLRGGARSTPRAARTILRLGAFQALFLDRIPPHAIVDESARLARRAGLGAGAVGFVNAVMRRIVDLPREEALAPPAPGDRAGLARRYSMPPWILDEIEAVYGPAALAAELAAQGEPAPLDLRLNSLRGDPAEILARLEAEASALGIEPQAIERGRFSPGAVRLRAPLDPLALAVFREGLVTAQDEVSQLAALWLDPAPGARVVDFCAAPGGKTAALAARMNGQGELWALDASESRLNLLRETFRRLGIREGEGGARIALNTPGTRTQWTQGGGRLDAALVDPPCSNLGALRRHPDVKWRKRPGDPARFAATQGAILREAAACVRPGGALVYCVCTFPRAETCGVIEAFLRGRPEWSRDTDWRPPIAIPAEWKTSDGDWRTSVSRDGLDAFFLARLRKNQQSV